MAQTNEEFDQASARCREIFAKKLKDYGASWRLMRPESVTDQLLIKANRIRCLEVKKEAWVNEGIQPEYMAIVNYGAVALIQCERSFADIVDMEAEEALASYDKYIKASTELMHDKNHDYDEAWRLMRTSSYTDVILVKLQRIKEIEDHHGRTSVSEGVESNYMDIINYALFALIKLAEAEEQEEK
ncbi:MAG: DUF1599 domain-containing protein [Tannerella sp.]|jgi:hypothetical protein|nr:DUF1599 domain-containing protein [Tannerella sp.]